MDNIVLRLLVAINLFIFQVKFQFISAMHNILI